MGSIFAYRFLPAFLSFRPLSEVSKFGPVGFESFPGLDCIASPERDSLSPEGVQSSLAAQAASYLDGHSMIGWGTKMFIARNQGCSST